MTDLGEIPGKLTSERPWLRRTWRFTALALTATLVGSGVLLARDHQLLGGYSGAGTDLCVNLLVFSGPALLLGALALVGIGALGLARAGPYRGYGLTTLAGLALSIVGLLGTLLAVGIASAPP